MRYLLLAVIVISGCSSQQFQQHNTHWSDNALQIMVKCAATYPDNARYQLCLIANNVSI